VARMFIRCGSRDGRPVESASKIVGLIAQADDPLAGFSDVDMIEIRVCQVVVKRSRWFLRLFYIFRGEQLNGETCSEYYPTIR
jgi:hypothetical protein